MKDILKKHHISFKNAFAGIKWAIRTQPNFRVHLVLAAIALMLANYLKINFTQLTIIIFVIILVLAAEMINTSIESMTDLITSQWHEEAKIAKDVAAGMMLLVATGSLAVGFLIFIPYILRMLGY